MTDLSYSVRCDCSMCRRHGAMMVRCHEDELKIVAGQEALSEYRFNTNVARHHFCSICGVYTFHRMRKLPDHYGVNVGCLEEVDFAALKPILIEGSRLHT
jgi:hypothetical protein